MSALKTAFLATLIAVNGLTFTSGAIRAHDDFARHKTEFTQSGVLHEAFNSASKENAEWIRYSNMSPFEFKLFPPKTPSEWVAHKTGSALKGLNEGHRSDKIAFVPGAIVSLAGMPGEIVGTFAGAAAYGVKPYVPHDLQNDLHKQISKISPISAPKNPG
ncbi:MAG: hypothetical protein GC185_10675 [Alphaproteobacteria bacterium]|nr:hypothetical protein [Alphaproteobacteria bacterium]